MNDTNTDAPALVRRRRRIARQQREKTPEPISKIGGIRPKYSDEDSSSTTNTTTTEHERPAILPAENENQRTKSKRSSTSSGNGTYSSNTAYREKILNRRDRGNKTATHELIRSQSQPRQLQPDAISDGECKTGKDSGKPVIRFFRRAKRSLSIPRRKKDVACGTSPTRQNEEIIKRYGKVSTAKAEPKVTNTLAENENEKRISKLEQNLRRFEDDRRRFILEKEKFEKERRQMEQVRFQRLIEFERKRNTSIQHRERERLAVEAAAIALAEIENQRLILKKRRSSSKSCDNSPSGNSETRYADDYVSSTASTISSRAADFDDVIGMREVVQMNGEHSSNINGTVYGPHDTDPIIESSTQMELKQSWLSRLVFGKRKHIRVRIVEKKSYRHLIVDDGGPISIKRILTIEAPLVWQQMIEDHSNDWKIMMRVRNRCIAHLVLLSILVGMGGLIFRFIEGTFENFYKCGVRRVKREFIDQLWDLSNDMGEDDWKDLARTKLRGFEEELHNAHEAGFRSYSGLNVWTFINGVVFCVTVVTTIGYGHISPATTTGRAITIIYSIIGIPLFLILLADFGKLFTRGIKFVWAYVRRLYYTGSLRRMRKQAQVQEMLRGIEMAYEIATFRRPSMMMKQSDLERAQTATPNSSSNVAATGQSETPSTPIPSEIEIDDEFNLPISVALIILITYILCGAAFYSISEGWSFFDACYFVFISMSTIGFGDFVPHHPIRMMCSIIYLIFGLALTSMCINVVQVKLSDSFRQASAKISATIGLTLAEEEARSSQNLTPVPENVSVHSYGKKMDTFKTNPDANVYDNAEMHDGQMITKPDGAPPQFLPPQKSPDQLAPPAGPHDKIKSNKNITDYNNKQTRK